MSEGVKKTEQEFRDHYHGYRNSSPAEVRRELVKARQMIDLPVVAVDFGLLYGIRLRQDAERWSLKILPEAPIGAAATSPAPMSAPIQSDSVGL